MIKIENTEVVGLEHAIRGCRNSFNSWSKIDSEWTIMNQSDYELGCDPNYEYVIGENDHDLMMKLCNAGTDHRKFMRMITVYVDVTAPLYWWKEFDTYKVGTVANSCSIMHKIHAKEFTMEDFSCEHLISEYCEDKCKEVESKSDGERITLEEFPNYEISNTGKVYRKDHYKTYKNGKKVHYDAMEMKQKIDIDNYKTVGFVDNNGKIKRIKVHRLVALAFIPKVECKSCVNHIDGNKWNNDVSNLEWCTRSENSKHAFENGLARFGYKQRKGLAKLRKFDEDQVELMFEMRNSGMSYRKISDYFNCDHTTIMEIIKGQTYKQVIPYPLELLEETVDVLNELREKFNETKDKQYWYSIIQLLPSSYNQRRTVMLNYEVLANIYKARKNHRLDEWYDLCAWIESLPYSELITGDKD